MLESARLVSIIREVEEKEIISIIEGLVEEGIRWFEISLSDGENGMKCIRTSRKYFEGRDVYIGAGTVKKKEEIDVLSDMGVPYILTPGFDEQIVRYALEKKIEVLPGSFVVKQISRVNPHFSTFIHRFCKKCHLYSQSKSIFRHIQQINTKMILFRGLFVLQPDHRQSMCRSRRSCHTPVTGI